MSNLPLASSFLTLGGPQNTQGAGGGVIPAGKIPVVLSAGIATNTAGNRLGFYQCGAASNTQYQVPANETYVGVGFWTFTNSAAAEYFAFGHNTSSFSNNSTPSSDVYYQASTTMADSGICIYVPTDTAQNTTIWVPFPVVFPASVYPFVRMSGSQPQGVYLVGYTVP